MYRPIAQIKRITSCFKVFVFIIGGNYKLIKLLIFKSTTKFKFGLQKRTYSSIWAFQKINVVIFGTSVFYIHKTMPNEPYWKNKVLIQFLKKGYWVKNTSSFLLPWLYKSWITVYQSSLNRVTVKWVTSKPNYILNSLKIVLPKIRNIIGCRLKVQLPKKIYF